MMESTEMLRPIENAVDKMDELGISQGIPYLELNLFVPKWDFPCPVCLTFM